jgi:magnesium-transporting ATPase (P-type)
MGDAAPAEGATPTLLKAKRAPKIPTRILLVPYPKIVFLYPTFLAAFGAALCMAIFNRPFDPHTTSAVVVAEAFLAIFAVNLVILAFDFPRTTSLTLFFLAAALVMGFILVMTLWPHFLPAVSDILKMLHPVANATFYWTITLVLAVIFIAVMIVVRFDYWEVRPNELLHHHGILANMERLSAPSLRLDKEITDVFEYFLLRSGRLILTPSGERRAIILDNVPFIRKKEEAITRMLGALQVQVRDDKAGGA